MPTFPRRLGTQTSRAAGVLRRSLTAAASPAVPPPALVCGAAGLVPRRLFSASPRCLDAPPPPPGSGADRRGVAPPTLPAAGYTALSTRRVICLTGPDSAKFLQGMITSNIYRLVPSADGNDVESGFYSGFLNAVGRVLHDVFIYANTLGLEASPNEPPKPGESFLIECSNSHANQLMLLLRKYRLRNKIKFRLLDLDECQAWQVWQDEEGPLSDDARLVPATPDKIVLRDPRAPGMGLRVLSTRDIGPDVAAVPGVDEAAYRLRRYLRGVAEGGVEIQSQSALPLEANMDAMGGIDYRKGCYVGQELTIRTKHRGVVRKRILPVMLYGPDEPAPDRLEFRPPTDADAGPAAMLPAHASINPTGRGRSAGNFLEGVGNIGLGLCRLGMMTDVQLPGEEATAPADPNREFLVRTEDEGTLKVKAFVPDWLRAKIEGGDAPNH